MAALPAVYLDIETTWEGTPTVVGFRSQETGLVQLVGAEITKSRLQRELPKSGRLYTFNGHSFDLPRLKTVVGIDLHTRFQSRDLRTACRAAGLTGGQKPIEREIGFSRRLGGVDGKEAINLWRRFEYRGDENALQTLLRYNREDLDGLRAIKSHLYRFARRCLSEA